MKLPLFVFANYSHICENESKMKSLRILFPLLAIAVMMPSCMHQGKFRPLADEEIIARSPNPDSIFLYTPGITVCASGRYVVSIDYGGPGTFKLDGPLSDFGDYKSGNQIRVLLSDDKGESWTESDARIPMMHEILFEAGGKLYMIGHSGRLLISCSTDEGTSWSEPSVLCAEPRWHQSCTSVDIHEGTVRLVYEKWVSEGHKWPGVGPVLMQADENSDLTLPESWRFSELYNPDCDMLASRPSGIPLTEPGSAGMLETNVVRIHNPQNPFSDSTGNSVVLMARANTGWPDIGVMLKGYTDSYGNPVIGRLRKNEGEVYFTHIPGGELKFHVVYDPVDGLYWLLHSQIDGRMNSRRRLALSFSPDLIRWTFAGLVAVGPSDNGARHYGTMAIDGDDLLIVSRSGDTNARNAHDGNIVTFHRVKNFRSLVY